MGAQRFEHCGLNFQRFFAQILEGGYVGDTWCLIVSPVVPAAGRKRLRSLGCLLASAFMPLWLMPAHNFGRVHADKAPGNISALTARRIAALVSRQDRPLQL